MKKHSTLFIGLDTHKDSIAVAYATDSRSEPVTVDNTAKSTTPPASKAVKPEYC